MAGLPRAATVEQTPRWRNLVKAALRDRYGPPEVVEVREVERPTPGEGELLVRVMAASVNRADLDGLTPKPGFVRLFLGVRKPRDLRMGSDVAGVVEALGPGAGGFKVGDRVFGDLGLFRNGSFAEFVAAPATVFLASPAAMSFEEASTLPHSAILAIQGLRRRTGPTIKPGDKVLIDGASGNVGPFAVQIAKSMGAEVTAVASTSKLDLVRDLGADHVIDYRQTDYTKTGERYDWILDVDAHHGLLAVRRALNPRGTYISLGGTGGAIFRSLVLGLLLSRFSDKWSGLLVWWKPFEPTDVAKLLDLIATGAVTPVIDRTFPLDDIVAALRWVDDGHARGKVIVIP
jgi:NADPH:quinone reductase-like Zn-dependent oxidoreductase